MKKAPAVSLILATYEMPRHLEMVLTALANQSFQDFEILLTDDGSGEDTHSIIQRFRSRIPGGITHYWQENRGFRKCRILNEAIRNSRGEICVFLDGDCVPHRDFIADHWNTRKRGTFGAGRRVELSRAVSESLTSKDVENGLFNSPSMKLLKDHFFGETENWNRTIRWGRLLPIRKILRLDRIDDMKGCNFSLFRDDLFAINGFDEGYEGYGREDTDVEIRLRNLGLYIRSMKGIALQFHVWHERRGFTPVNDALLEQARHTKRIRCEKGIVGGNSDGILVRA